MATFKITDFKLDKDNILLTATYEDLVAKCESEGRLNVFSKYCTEQSIRITANVGSTSKFVVTKVNSSMETITSWELESIPKGKSPLRVVITRGLI